MLLELNRWRRRILRSGEESGLATVELLGNAALAVLALVAIWGAIRSEIVPQFIDLIRNSISGSE